MQSSSSDRDKAAFHVAIIMDGNGRWATARGLPREAGHRAGMMALRRVVEAAPSFGITALTVYAFSTENWSRPPHEVDALMMLLHRFLRRDVTRLAEAGVRVTSIGRRDRLAGGIANLLAQAEAATADGTTLDLRLAIDYSARDTIIDAVMAADTGKLSREAVSERLALKFGGPDVDLVIRTSGEQRLSDFMLWEAAYAEFYFTPVLWPDFGGATLERAIAAFRTRNRRFGGLGGGMTSARISQSL
jgi:undecaprenyl diphosphate synthase